MRLFSGDVDCGSRDCAVLNRLDQCGFVHASAACHVDEKGGLLHARKRVGIDDLFGYNGPSQMTTRILHKPEYSGEAALAAFNAVIHQVQEEGIGADELEQLKVKWRSDYYATLESGRGNYMPKYGLMHLLACFTLFDDEPQLVNRILEGFLAVTPEQVHSVAKKYLRNEKRAIVFRAPAKIGSPADAGVREAA